MKVLSVAGYEEIEAQYGFHALAAKVCAAKALNHDQIAELTDDREFTDPLDAMGMREVIDRILSAKKNNEKVLVCGDYDADGICATAILHDALQRCGIDSGFYIPNRLKEGYGLHPHTVEMAKERGYSLLITVDNGVKAFDALQRCRELEINTIVTDHHTIAQAVPCDLLLHSHTMGDAFVHLCGAGIALCIARALVGEIKEHVVLAAVASLGDVMPLWKETRKIVKRGLQYLNEGICLPIQSLRNKKTTKWDESTVAFQIVPKLNATGRLADLVNANNTVRYLLLNERRDILPVAAQIEALNQHRRQLSTKMNEFAQTLICPDQRFLVLADEAFHEGLIGIIAGRLCEAYHRPTAVFAINGELAKGSIRSIESIDLRPIFADCPIPLLAYGGHKAAAGLTLKQVDLPRLTEYLQTRIIAAAIEADDHEREVIPITMADLDWDAVAELERFAPFGEGFAQPLFYIEAFPVKAMLKLSQGKHVKWESLNHVEALYFNAKDVYAKYDEQKQLSLLGHLATNQFRNEKKVNIFVSDVIS